MSTGAPTTGRSIRRGGLVRTIWTLAGDRRPILARSIGWKAAQGAAQAIPVAVIVVLVDEVRIGALEAADIGWSVAIIAACITAQWVFGYLSNRSAWIATYEMFGELRIDALDHVRRVPLGFHDERRSGDTVTALTQDITTVEGFTHEPLQQLIGAVTTPIVVFLVLVVVDVPMAFATVISILGAVPIFTWTNRSLERLARERQDQQAEASARMLEYLQGLAVIRSFRLTGERLELFRSAMDDFRAANLRLLMKLTPIGMAFTITILLGVPCVLFFGALWLFDGTIDVGTLIVFAVLVLRVYQPLLAGAESFEGMRIADASLDRVARVLETPVQPMPADPASGFDPLGPLAVSFDAVSFAYQDGQPVLHDVSFEAAPSAMTAIVGPSGSGKSTLLNLIARFWDPQDGTVRLAGIDLRDLTAEQLFDAVTVVFQDVYLFPGTIFDNIAFGRPDADRADVERAAAAAQAHAFITELPDGYDTAVDEAGGNLSGGERQRIAIARAILKDAPIILLDEATSAIDPTNERMVQRALAELVAGKTVVVVAHRLSTISPADRIVGLEAGRAVEHGDHDSLIARDGVYRRLWDERRRASRWRLGGR